MATESTEPVGNGLLLFKAALERSPDVIALIQSIARPQAKEQGGKDKAGHLLQDMQATKSKPRPSSGHKYGSKERFRSRPTSAPGPGQYISRRVSLNSGPKMTSRHDSFVESSPGPQTYLLPETKDSTSGIMPREVRYKDNSEFYQTFLGPGSYDHSGSNHEAGWKFAKEGREAELDVTCTQPTTGIKKKPEVLPGPGHYSTRSSVVTGGYSIPRSQPTHRRLSTTLGPGAYSIIFPTNSIDFSFSEAPRFSTTMKDSLQGKLYTEYYPRHRYKSQQEKTAEITRFQQNMDSKKWTKSAKKRNLREQGNIRDKRISMAAHLKTALIQTEKLKKQLAYEEKMEKFQFRMRKEEIEEIKISWFTVLCFSSSICDVYRGFWQLKVPDIQQLHIRSETILRKFRRICIVLGKFQINLRNIRKRRSIRVSFYIDFAGYSAVCRSMDVKTSSSLY